MIRRRRSLAGITFSFVLLCSALVHTDAGPPVFETESLTAAVAGRYRYKRRNERSQSGTVEFRIQFAPRAEGSEVRATFGDTDYVVSSVSLVLDGKRQKFPTDLLQPIGYCVPDRIFLFPDDDPGSVLLSAEFSSGVSRYAVIVRIRDGIVTPGPTGEDH